MTNLEKWFKTYQGAMLIYKYDSHNSGITYSPVDYYKDVDLVMLDKYDSMTPQGYMGSFSIDYEDLRSYTVIGDGLSEKYLSNDNSPKWTRGMIYIGAPPTCNHKWVTTKGFSSDYIDCSICGAKHEED